MMKIMRGIGYLVFLVFSVSCKEKSITTTTEGNTHIQIDTVNLDSKGEILFLGHNLSLSDFSEKRSLLYNFNPINFSIEILDLDRLEFVGRIQYEEEGPNGVGKHVNGFQLVGKDSVFINSFHQYGIFDLNGKKILDLGFRGINFEGQDVDDFFKSTNLHINPKSPKQMAGVFDDWRSGDRETVFGLLDLQKKDFELFSLEAFDYLNGFAPRDTNSGRKQPLFWVIANLEKNSLLIHNNIGAGIYKFNFEDSRFEHLGFDHQLFPSRKTIRIPAETGSFAENHRYYLESQEDINFSRLVWDEENQVFYRFSYFNQIGDVDGELKAKSARVFLCIFDSEFELKKELEMHELTKAPNFHFVKDGKIWIFENNGDEVSFIRIEII